MSNKVQLMEVTPRDGLQNEKFFPSHEEKLAIIHQLADCGFKHIEVGAFVHPKVVPQMAGTSQLFADLFPAPTQMQYYGLVPNLKGYELALDAGVKNLGYVLAVTETMNRENVRMGVEESFKQFAQIAKLAEADKVKLRIYLAVVFHCPFEGETSWEKGLDWVKRMADLGIEDICLADTDGNARPDHTERLIEQAADFLQIMNYPSHISLHLHQTYGFDEENLRRALKLGIRHFDSATAGMGGCPFAPGAKGNISSEKVVAICESLGYKTGIDLEKLKEFSHWLIRLKENALKNQA